MYERTINRPRPRTMTKKRNIIGQKFGNLTVLADAPNKYGRTASLCICKCGKKVVFTNLSIIQGNAKTCGCGRKENMKWRPNLNVGRTTHGLFRHPVYSIFQGMKDRCYNKNSQDYKYYGGRGIKICPEWLRGVEFFHTWAINNGWVKGLTIERLDNNKGYNPENCIWATRQVQGRNTRRVIRLTFNGETNCISEWAEKTSIGLTPKVIKGRINLGWPTEKILTTPKMQRYGRRY